jgi:hypothetical protein
MLPSSPSTAHVSSSPRKNKFLTPAGNGSSCTTSAHSPTSQGSPSVVQGDMKFIYEELQRGHEERRELSLFNDELNVQLLDMSARIKKVRVLSNVASFLACSHGASFVVSLHKSLLSKMW